MGPRNFVFIPSFYLALPPLRAEGDINIDFKEMGIECLGYWNVPAMSFVIIKYGL